MPQRLFQSSGSLSPAAIDLLVLTELLSEVTVYAAADAGARAKGTVTLSADLAAAEKVTIATHDFAFVDADPTGDQVLLGATLIESAANLAAAINASTTEGITGVVTATASASEGKVYVRADAVGAGGNDIALTKTGAHIAVSAATLAGGGTDSRTMTISVLGDDDAVLFTKDVTLAVSTTKAVTIAPNATGTDPLGLPLLLARKLRVAVPVGTTPTAALVSIVGR